MFRLPLGIGLGDQGSSQPITRIHQAEQPLALAHTHLHTVAFPHTSGETFSIPKVGLHLRSHRRLSNQAAHFLQLLGRQTGGTSGMVALGETGQALQVKAPHPIDDGAWRVSEESSDLLAAQTGSDEQDAVQSVIISGVLMTIDFLLQHSKAVLRQGQR